VSKVFSVFRFMQSKELNYILSVIGVGSDDGGRSERWEGASPNFGSYCRLHSSHRLFGEKNDRSNFDKKLPVSAYYLRKIDCERDVKVCAV